MHWTQMEENSWALCLGTRIIELYSDCISALLCGCNGDEWNHYLVWAKSSSRTFLKGKELLKIFYRALRGITLLLCTRQFIEENIQINSDLASIHLAWQCQNVVGAKTRDELFFTLLLLMIHFCHWFWFNAFKTIDQPSRWIGWDGYQRHYSPFQCSQLISEGDAGGLLLNPMALLWRGFTGFHLIPYNI